MSTLPHWMDYPIIGGMALSEVLLLALPALLWVRMGRQNFVEAFAWRRASEWEGLGAALMALGLLPWVQTVVVVQGHLWPRLGGGQDANAAFLLPLLARHPWLTTGLLALSAAVCEEMLFRGPLLRALLRRMPARAAVGIGALVFALAHFDLPGLLVRTILGVLLGLIVLRGRSLFPAIVLHFVYDAGALGGAAWDVHALGLAQALRQASLTDLGVSRTQLIAGPVVGSVLIALGWGLCLSAWRRRGAGLTL